MNENEKIESTMHIQHIHAVVVGSLASSECDVLSLGLALREKLYTYTIVIIGKHYDPRAQLLDVPINFFIYDSLLLQGKYTRQLRRRS